MTDNTARWRDLADELNPTQLAELAALDVGHPGAVGRDAGMLAAARMLAGRNLLSIVHGDVAPPDEATAWHEWVDDGGIVQRYFVGRVWSTAGGEVSIRGYQHADGTVTDRHIVVSVPAEPVNPDAVRQRARAEVAAADEIDRSTRWRLTGS
jgi:hypothetical protein